MPHGLILLAGGAVAAAALWQGNEALDKLGTVTKWAVIGGGVYVAAKALKVL
jgi:hypothetical protein